MVSRKTSLVLLYSVFILCSLVASESSESSTFSSNVDDVSYSPPLPPGLEGLYRSSGGDDDVSSVAILAREEALAKLPASLSSASDDALADARLRAERLRDDYRARVASADETLAALRAETERLRAEEREWTERVSTNALRTSELVDERVPAHNARELRSLRDALATRDENDDDEEKDDRNEEDDDEEEKDDDEEEEDESSYVTVEELESDMEDLLSPSQPWERELEERVTNVTKELLAEAFDEERRTAERELLRYEDRLLAARDAVVAENDSASSSSCTARDDLVKVARRALSLNPDVDDAVETDLTASPRVRVAYGDVEEEDPDAPGRRRRRPLTSPTRVSTPLGAVSAAVGATHGRVLDPDTSRGACWPVAHRPGEEARLALVLARPALVTAATIHHGRDSRSSAPRRLRVLGYGPCDDDDPTCASLGFDPRTSYVLSDGEEYDADRGGVAQTFRFADSGNTGATKTTEETPDEEEKDDDSEPSFGGASAGQCSMPPPAEDGEEEVVPSCGGPPPVQEEPPVVKAVQLIVETNWGNPDYTCLYRFQVFGREVTTTSSS